MAKHNSLHPSVGENTGWARPWRRNYPSPKGSLTHISTPRLKIHQPDNPNGIAVLVISGGGYAHIESGSEGYPRRMAKI
jgi:hypothetical protein